MTVFVLGFVGFPVSGGFWGKVLVFSAAVDRGWTWLVIVGVAATAISLYYYLAIVRAMWMRSPELRLAPAGGSPPRECLLQASVVVCLGVPFASLLAVQPLIDLAKHATRALPL